MGGLKHPHEVGAVGEVFERLPGAFFGGVALPLDEVVDFAVGPASLEDFLDLPLGGLLHGLVYIEGNVYRL